MLIEHCIAESPDLRKNYRSFWHGIHAAVPSENPAEPSLMSLATEKGIPSTLITDAEWLANDPLAESFHECVLLKDSDQATEPASTTEETRVARLFAEATDFVSSAKEAGIYWIHADAMNGLWQAPTRLREQFVGDEDPDPPTFVEPPHQNLESPVDPDKLLALSQAYAAEVQVVDECLFEFLEMVRQSKLSQSTDLAVIATSPRGYALGEHNIVGDGAAKQDVGCLHAESLGLPLLMQLPAGRAVAARDQRLAQHCDVFATIGEWLKLETPSSPSFGSSLLSTDSLRQRAFTIGANQMAIRTASWSWISSRICDEPAINPPQPALFVKPDDRCEVNDVVKLCHQVAEEFEKDAAHCKGRFGEGKLPERLAEESVLVQPHD